MNGTWWFFILSRYELGDIVRGKVTRLTNFGVFVELQPDLEGLLHISEVTDPKVVSLDEVVKVLEPGLGDMRVL